MENIEKHLKEVEQLTYTEKIENISTDNYYSVCYMDFCNDNPNQKANDEDSSSFATKLNLYLYSRDGKFQSTFDHVDLRKEIVEKIVSLGDKAFENLQNLSSDEKNKLITIKESAITLTLLALSNIIATNSRVGRANTCIMSFDIFNKFAEEVGLKLGENSEFDFIGCYGGLNICVDKTLKNTITVYRKSQNNETGLKLFYTDEYYDIVELGFKPELHYITIHPSF